MKTPSKTPSSLSSREKSSRQGGEPTWHTKPVYPGVDVCSDAPTEDRICRQSEDLNAAAIRLREAVSTFNSQMRKCELLGMSVTVVVAGEGVKARIVDPIIYKITREKL